MPNSMQMGHKRKSMATTVRRKSERAECHLFLVYKHRWNGGVRWSRGKEQRKRGQPGRVSRWPLTQPHPNSLPPAKELGGD